MLNVTLGQIRSIEPVLGKLLEQPINISIAWKLQKVINILAQELEQLEQFRAKLIEKYGQQVWIKVYNTGNQILETDYEQIKNLEDNPEENLVKVVEQTQVLENNLEAFKEDFKDLLNVSIKLDYEPVSITVFGDDISLSINEINALKVLFVD